MADFPHRVYLVFIRSIISKILHDIHTAQIYMVHYLLRSLKFFERQEQQISSHSPLTYIFFTSWRTLKLLLLYLMHTQVQCFYYFTPSVLFFLFTGKNPFLFNQSNKYAKSYQECVLVSKKLNIHNNLFTILIL